ncbi:holin family protein [Marivita sp. S0852]|uniref:holin family protein n=1 Tax=Marivita sp. S0852 TaxID=3373893 RepID=UPI003981BF06
MGLIEQLFSLVFGSGRNVLRETAEVFRPNAEAQSVRDHTRHAAALRQFGHEFLQPKRGGFDRFMDGLNRVPRPALALGTLGLFISAMVDPVWFAARMAGIALVPEPLWWLLGAIVSFYFGARHQAKGQDFQRDLTRQLDAALPDVLDRLDTLKDAQTPAGPVNIQGNAALQDWKGQRDP